MKQAEQRREDVVERRGEPDAVNAWLRQGLAKRYATVLQEALPLEWLELLARPHA